MRMSIKGNIRRRRRRRSENEGKEYQEEGIEEEENL